MPKHLFRVVVVTGSLQPVFLCNAVGGNLFPQVPHWADTSKAARLGREQPPHRDRGAASANVVKSDYRVSRCHLFVTIGQRETLKVLCELFRVLFTTLKGACNRSVPSRH
jgi:hypothetical protein